MLGALEVGDPQRIAGYWLAGRLGAGGQGIVFEAYDAHGVRVALKLLHGRADRVAKEVAAARQVASFCTAKILAADLAGERPHIVSEYVDGPSLRRAVTESGPVTGDGLHRLATAIATALAAIHQAGVIHRDLKPDNVLLGADGPRVIDFGIARTEEMSLTSTGALVGTPTYMAPEVLNGERAGRAADVFAWGAVMVFAATGRDPFRADNVGAVLHRVLSSEPDLSALPSSVRPLVAAALSKVPSDRPTAKGLLLALIGAQEELLAAGSRIATALPGPTAREPGLGERAEETYLGLSTDAQELVPGLLLRLVSVEEDTEEVLRRADRAELLQQDHAEAVLAGFATAGLLVQEDSGVRLAHPGLLTAWPRLREWLDAERLGLPIHRRLSATAFQWEASGRRVGDLYHGTPLEGALQWAATGRRHLTLNATERAFLDASAAATLRQTRRRRLLTGVLAVLLAIAVGASLLADQQRRTAIARGDELAASQQRVIAQRNTAAAKSVAARAPTLRATDPQLAMLLSVAAWRIAPSAETRSALHQALAQPELDTFTDPEIAGDIVYGLGRHGQTLAAAGRGRARVFDVATKKVIMTIQDIGPKVYATALSPDGMTLAVQTDKHVQLWDTRSGRRVGAGLGPPGNGVLWGRLEFDTTGRRLYTSGGYDSSQSGWWDLRTRKLLRAPDGENLMAVSPDGRFGASAKNQVWNLVTRQRVPLPDDAKRSGYAFSPDSKLLAVSGDPARTTTTTLYNLAAASERCALQVGLAHMVFSDDATLMIGQAADGGILVHVPTCRILWRGGPLAERFGADGTTLHGFAAPQVWYADYEGDYQGRRDGSVWTRDIFPGVAVSRLGAVENGPRAVLSADASRAAVRSAQNMVQVWNVPEREKIGKPIVVAEPSLGTCCAIALSPDGKFLAAAGVQVGVWEVATGRRLRRFAVKNTNIEAVSLLAFSGDGSFLAVRGLVPGDSPIETKPPVELWDWRSGKGRIINGMSALDMVTFRPDGRVLAGSGWRDVLLADVATATRVDRKLGSGAVPDGYLAFSPRGDLAAIGDPQGRMRLWDGDLTAPVGQHFVPVTPSSPITNLEFAPDGQTVASISRDGSVHLWDVASRTELGRVMGARPGVESPALAFDGNSSVLYVVDESGEFRSVAVDPARITADLCSRAGRRLTEQEWAQYFDDVPYREICP
ncbi:protein kinase [Nonomuraea spiralis]|uniref:Protein kinase n=1 Tax=Nonomuraea spiralis TaxID=46182 RepID=A0ABV5IST3_9ACTN|nr:serine/threonine-protein kinase [Nonomuraea spiralis]GGT45863.1 hypothetical protein GCM10010176_106310 [Nonomuraea spiralis]